VSSWAKTLSRWGVIRVQLQWELHELCHLLEIRTGVGCLKNCQDITCNSRTASKWLDLTSGSVPTRDKLVEIKLDLIVSFTNPFATNLACTYGSFTVACVGLERHLMDLTFLAPSFFCPEGGVNQLGKWNFVSQVSLYLSLRVPFVFEVSLVTWKVRTWFDLGCASTMPYAESSCADRLKKRWKRCCCENYKISLLIKTKLDTSWSCILHHRSVLELS